MIRPTSGAILAGLALATALAGSALARDRPRPTIPAGPSAPAQPVDVVQAYITEKCSGSGRFKTCKYILRCDSNNAPGGTFNTYADAFTANFTKCSPRNNRPVAQPFDPDQPAPRDSGAVRTQPKPQ